MPYFRVNNKCNGCLACVQNCPADALDSRDIGNRRTLLHNITRCARCGNCWRICPQEAIEFEYLLKGEWDEVVALKLLRCRICGEVVHPELFGDSVSGKLHKKQDDLCPKHRESIDSLASAYVQRRANK